jgi:integrase
MAEKFRRKTEGQLAAGTYQQVSKNTWADFRREYEQRGLPGAAAGTCEVAGNCLDHFERIIRPARVTAITSRVVAEYVAKRQAERIGGSDGPNVSPATVNKELRHLRAVLRKAYKWGYLARVPEFDFLREPGKLHTYVTPEHLAKLYANAGAARWPTDGPFDVADWWRGLLVTAYMTGWRIGSLLALCWADVDLDNGWALSRAADNKGKRDQRVTLHPIVVDHLRKLVSFSPVVFPWNRSRRGLYDEFSAIQRASKVRPDGKRQYGFHDFRRAFATMNAERMTADALQSLMQHKAYATTQKYVNLSRQLNAAVQNLYVPELPNTSAG